MKAMRAEHILIPALILCVARRAGSSAEVETTTSPYSCCEPLQLHFNPKCENTWHVRDKVIAHYNDKTQERTCLSPCKALDDGQLTLDRCVETVIAEVACDIIVRDTQDNFVKEELVHHRGEPCSKTTTIRAAASSAAASSLCCPVVLLLGLWLAT